MQKLSRVNKGYKYLLTVIDTFSKSAWVQPLKEKTSSKMVKVFKTILKRASSRQPIRLQTDLKAKNCLISQICQKSLYTSRDCGTFSLYENILQDLVKGYNSSLHSSIGKAPENVVKKDEPKIWTKLYRSKRNKRKPSFKVGNHVHTF